MPKLKILLLAVIYAIYIYSYWSHWDWQFDNAFTPPFPDQRLLYLILRPVPSSVPNSLSNNFAEEPKTMYLKSKGHSVV